MLAFLRARAIDGRRSGRRHVATRARSRSHRGDDRCAGWISVTKSPPAQAALARGGVGVARSRRPGGAFARQARVRPRLRSGTPSPRSLARWRQAHPGLRVPGTFDGFELAVRAVVGQQITVRGGAHAARSASSPRSANASCHGRFARRPDAHISLGERTRGADSGGELQAARLHVGACADADRARARRCEWRRSTLNAGRRRRTRRRAALETIPASARGRRDYIAMRALRLARCVSRQRSRRAARRWARRAPRVRAPQRSVAPLARLRRHAPLEKQLHEHDQLTCRIADARSAPCCSSRIPATRWPVFIRWAEILSRRCRCDWRESPRLPVLREARDATARVLRRRAHANSTCRSHLRGTPFQRGVWSAIAACRSVRRSATASSRAGADVRRRCARRVLRPAAIRCRSSCRAIGSSAAAAR